MRIDAHQHFWRYRPEAYAWIGEGMEVLRGDFFPPELSRLLKENGFDGCVAVQSEQTEEHSSFLLGLAEKYDFIKGVVGWVDLSSDDIHEKATAFRDSSKMKGFRHILQDESRRDMMLNPAFISGLRAIGRLGFTYDVLVHGDQLKFIEELLPQCPDQLFVLDHLGKPPIKSGEIEDWKKTMNELSRFENLHCKISGMVTEADWQEWQSADLVPYLDCVVEAFGVDRLMFGSDWPVCLLAADYGEVISIVENYFSSFTETEREKIFGENAIAFYKL